MIVCQKVKVPIISVKQEIGPIFLFRLHQFHKKFHSFCKQDGFQTIRAILPAKPAAIHFHLQEDLQPQFFPAAPFHQCLSAVINHVAFFLREKHPCHTGTFDFHRVQSNFLDFSRSIITGSPDSPPGKIRGKNRRLLIPENFHSGVPHHNIHGRHTCQPQPAGLFTFQPICFRCPRQEKGKPFRILLHQQFLGRPAQPESTQAIPVIGSEQPCPLQLFHHGILVSWLPWQAFQKPDREVTGNSSQFQELPSLCP